MRQLAVLLTVITAVYSYKYVVYNPAFGHSHTHYLCVIGDVLAAAGHDVTMLVPLFEAEVMKKPCGKLIKKFINVDMDQEILDYFNSGKEKIMADLWTEEPTAMGAIEKSKNMSALFGEGCKEVIRQDDILNRVKGEKFDVGIVEPFSICGFGVFEMAGIKKIISAVSNSQMDLFSWSIGEPLAPSYVPGMLSATGEKMSFTQRLGNALMTIAGIFMFDNVNTAEHKYLKEKFPEISSKPDLHSSASIVFTNSNPYLNYPRPVLHKTVEIGGITVEAEKNTGNLVLDEKWSKVLDERKHTVFISFGSMTKSKDMPAKWRDPLIQMFEKMQDVTFIWKYEKDTDMVNHLKNVYLSSWLPQKALLADNRLSIFITHGGLGSTIELAYMGKPAIMIPIFADQYRNAAMLARHGGVETYSKEDLANPAKLEAIIRKILKDKKYETNAKRLSETLRNKPISNTELLVKHAEFVAQFGPLNQLDAYSRHLSIFQVYFVDAALAVVSILLVIGLLLGICIRRVYRKCVGKKVKKD